MKILEVFLEGKTADPLLCEDAWIVTEHFAAVIDGATAKSALVIDGMATGKFIAEQIKAAVESVENPDLDSEAFVRLIESHLYEQYKARGLLGEMQKDPNKIPAASMAAYSRYRRQIWLFGDCQAFAGKRYTNFKPVDRLISMVRKYYIEYALLNGKTEAEFLDEDGGRSAIQPLLHMQQAFLNSEMDSPFSYSTISGFGYKMEDAKVIPVPAGVQEVVLASDGYPELFPDLAATERYLKEALAEDPLCYKKIISTKGIENGRISFDDRCYLKIGID
ncbi:hypothetical protein BpJC4_18830 [Weizmannia acidilactici]|uniref:hypothetical protein n=1 Tax=Weizmannia acidilactici TaxID=2607726 RepID=UPI00124DA802|nr:hypothetical protein [Weizmannia acidilactici]GER67412.1 hypothetical protein BpJC4_18830 [Weizmannia acidilactici]